MIWKVQDDLRLKALLRRILFNGETIPYSPYDISMQEVETGFIKGNRRNGQIANRIFETILYNFFLYEEEFNDRLISREGNRERDKFGENNQFNMEYILERFVTVFHDLCEMGPENSYEADGRRRFLLFIWSIINGKGNYYIEAQTRDLNRLDLVIDYAGEQFVVELKIWRGNSYNEREEVQLSSYLDYFHLPKGYMLSFNLNKNKVPGIYHIQLGDKELVEAVV